MPRILGESKMMGSSKDQMSSLETFYKCVASEASLILVVLAMAFPVVHVCCGYVHVIRGKINRINCK